MMYFTQFISKVLLTDVVNSIARVQVVVWRHTWSDVGDVCWSRNVVCVVKYLKLIEMCVAEELSRDCAFIALNNFVIVSAPDFEAIRVTGWDVTGWELLTLSNTISIESTIPLFSPNNVNFLIRELRTLQLINDPLKLSGGIG
jgi:hypothetical protein